MLPLTLMMRLLPRRVDFSPRLDLRGRGGVSVSRSSCASSITFGWTPAIPEAIRYRSQRYSNRSFDAVSARISLRLSMPPSPGPVSRDWLRRILPMALAPERARRAMSSTRSVFENFSMMRSFRKPSGRKVWKTGSISVVL